MKVLLSIKPEYVEKILIGTKKFEYRKKLFKKSGVKSVVIYASSPIKRIVGEFEIEKIMSGDIDVIWGRTYKYGGITREYYQSYFGDSKIANAIQIGQVTIYCKPMLLSDYNIRRAPQSFCYIY